MATYTDQQLDDFFRDLSGKTGATVEANDRQLLQNKLTGGSQYIANPDSAFQEFRDQYARRGASGQTGSGQDSTVLTGGNGTIQTASAGGGGGSSPYSSGGGSIDSALGSFLSTIKQDREKQQQEQASLREVLMSQLGQLQQPVSANDPGIREVLAGERIASQRGAERTQAAAAEQLAQQGLRDSGAADTARLGIAQQRGEADAQFAGQTLNQELQRRGDMLQSLLRTALQLGDSESARSIQAELAALGLQQNQSQFYDTQGYNYAALQAALNNQAFNGLGSYFF